MAAIETARGSRESRVVVLAAGAWTAALARLAGTRIPLQPGKGYHVQIGNGAPAVRVPIIFQESVFAAVPMSGELRLAGTMEFVGFDATLARSATDRLLEEARLYCPLPPTGDPVRPGRPHWRRALASAFGGLAVVRLAGNQERRVSVDGLGEPLRRGENNALEAQYPRAHLRAAAILDLASGLRKPACQVVSVGRLEHFLISTQRLTTREAAWLFPACSLTCLGGKA